MATLTVTQQICKNCGHTFIPRKADTKKCPKCNHWLSTGTAERTEPKPEAPASRKTERKIQTSASGDAKE